MKKLIALSILMTILASAVFAEDGKSSISITGSADAAVTPLQIIHGGEEHDDGAGSTYTDTYIGAGVGRPGDPQGPKVGLSAAADYEGILGAKVDLEFFYNTTRNLGGAEFGLGDFAEVWFKPTDWFKLDVGKFNEDILRGKVGDDNWAHWTVGMGGKDDIFNRFQGNAGFLAAFTPVEGLYIGVLVPKLAQFTDNNPFFTEDGSNVNNDTDANGVPWRAFRVYQRIQAGVGYEIQNIGLVRAQFVGANSKGEPNELNPARNGYKPQNYLAPLDISAPRIEAAFAYTGMEGLVIDLGLKFWIPVSDWTNDIWDPTKQEYTVSEHTGSWWKGIQIALGAGYTAGDIGINGRIDVKLAQSYTSDPSGMEISAPLDLNVHLWPSYNLGFATIGLDFGLQYVGATTVKIEVADVDDEFGGGLRVGFGLWLQKAFGPSSIKLGLAYRVGSEFGEKDKPGHWKEPGVLSIPIVFDYSF